MRIVECLQQSEQWEALRMMRPTASRFGDIITPAKGDLSSKSVDYACELVAKQMGVYTEPPPSYWMEWGIEHEQIAIKSYQFDTGHTVEKVGFAFPDDTEDYGCSPDGFVDNRTGLIEVKCPKPETVLRYHWEGVLPSGYKPQVQGQLLITGCEWCDFYAWHPDLVPFKVRVEPDQAYQEKMRVALEMFCEQLEQLREKVSSSGLQLIQWGE